MLFMRRIISEVETSEYLTACLVCFANGQHSHKYI